MEYFYINLHHAKAIAYLKIHQTCPVRSDLMFCSLAQSVFLNESGDKILWIGDAIPTTHAQETQSVLQLRVMVSIFLSRLRFPLTSETLARSTHRLLASRDKQQLCMDSNANKISSHQKLDTIHSQSGNLQFGGQTTQLRWAWTSPVWIGRAPSEHCERVIEIWNPETVYATIEQKLAFTRLLFCSRHKLDDACRWRCSKSPVSPGNTQRQSSTEIQKPRDGGRSWGTTLSEQRGLEREGFCVIQGI